MSAFTINTITIQGINIIAKLIAGSTLEFTKIELGDGQLQGINPQSVTALTNTVVTLPITAVSAADGTATVSGVFSNKDITTGFFYRELGLFAKDPETGEEKLYCYGNAENNAEWIPPSGTETVVEKKIKINTICGNATKVTATLASGIYVTKETVDQEIEIHNKDLGAHEVLFGEYTYYVNGTTGNDNNQGSEDKPLRTITKAVELIPGLAKAATVNIAAGTYNESIIISDKVRGKLSFIGADKDTTKVTSLKAEGNMYLCLMKLTFNSNGTPLRTVEFGCGTVSFSECKFIGNGASQSIGVAIHRANGIIYNCDFTGFNFGLMAAYGSGIFAYFLHCSNNTYDLYSNGGFISTDDNTTLTKFSDYGGIISSYAVGKSIAAGVADSTTDATDASKKLVTSEFLKKANQWSMPSSAFLTIAQGWVYDSNNARFVMSYTATANGHINYFVDLGQNANAKNVEVGMTNLTSGMIATDHSSVNKSVNGGVHTVACTLAVCKGETVQLTMTYDGCTASSSIWCPITLKFIYAKGEI